VDKYADPVTCACLNPPHDRHYFVPGLLRQRGISQMITSLWVFDACGNMSLGSVVLAFLYMERYKVSTMRTSQFRRHNTLL